MPGLESVLKPVADIIFGVTYRSITAGTAEVIDTGEESGFDRLVTGWGSLCDFDLHASLVKENLRLEG